MPTLDGSRPGPAGPDGVERRLRARPHPVRVLDVDPDLGADLSPEALAVARARLRAGVVELPGPGWDAAGARQAARPDWLGLLILDGIMLRQVSVAGRVAGELFGPGDVIRPWDADGEYEPLLISLTWRVIEPARLAVLDGGFARELADRPAIVSRLMGRIATRARTLALANAVSHLPRTEDRLLLLFWLLADRWGRVGPDGVRIRMPLTHELLATLVGAHRPSVTGALQRLTRADLLVREEREVWRLTRAAQRRLLEPGAEPVPRFAPEVSS